MSLDIRIKDTVFCERRVPVGLGSLSWKTKNYDVLKYSHGSPDRGRALFVSLNNSSLASLLNLSFQNIHELHPLNGVSEFLSPGPKVIIQPRYVIASELILGPGQV